MYKLLHSKRIVKFVPIFLANLFFSFHYNAVVYVNSSYLGNFFSRPQVSGLFILGSLLNLLIFIEAPRSLRRLGNRYFFLFLVSLEMFAIVVMAAAFAPIMTAIAFILFQGVSMVAYYALDIFLEDATEDKETGLVRGAFLTLTNITLVFSPLLISLLAPHGEFINVYIASIVFLVPVVLLGLFSFKRFTDAKHRDVRLPMAQFWKLVDIRRVTAVRLVLDTFYAFMVIYMPLYLHSVIGFSWEMIGVIFAFMLLPFVLFELPAGELADAGFGEKEMMTLGLFIMGTSLLIMPFLKSPDAFNWALVLFLSRLGASFTEIMTETYFFKHVDKSNTGLISIFRTTWPLGFILCPILATITFGLFPFGALFFVLAIIIYQAMELSALLRDTA